MSDLIVIFGARVDPDGTPSPALKRRVDGAVRASRAQPGAPLFCSGAAARGGPSEASVMARLLAEAGVARARLVLDEDSRDTLQTVVRACAHIRAHALARAIICSDTYHQPRIIALFRALGAEATAGPVRDGRREAGALYWLRMSLRESIATAYDLALVRLGLGTKLKTLQ